MRADVRLADPSRSPAPCLCGELLPSIRERNPARFSASLLLSFSYIHLRSGFVCQTITVATPYVQINKGGSPLCRVDTSNRTPLKTTSAECQEPFLYDTGLCSAVGRVREGVKGVSRGEAGGGKWLSPAVTARGFKQDLSTCH